MDLITLLAGALVKELSAINILLLLFVGAVGYALYLSRADLQKERDGRTADAIDWLFFWELDHCAAQWRREVLMGWHD